MEQFNSVPRKVLIEKYPLRIMFGFESYGEINNLIKLGVVEGSTQDIDSALEENTDLKPHHFDCHYRYGFYVPTENSFLNGILIPNFRKDNDINSKGAWRVYHKENEKQ